MKCHCDFYTIKSGKRNDLNNPITKAFTNLKMAVEQSSFEYTNNSDDADVVFVFGSITRRKLDTERARRILNHRLKGKIIFALDSALFSTYMRKHTNSSETNMFRIGLGDITGEGDFRNSGLDETRFQWFKDTFNFSEKNPTEDYNKPILFLLQSEKGWQYDELEPYWSYARRTVETIRKITERPIVLRGHPNLDRVPTHKIAYGISGVSLEQSERSRITMLDSIRKSGAVITHSSSGACEAIVEGVPTIALDKRCVVYDACLHSIDDLNHLEDFDWESRQRHLNEWAWSSWHVDEMKKPNLINHLMRGL